MSFYIGNVVEIIDCGRTKKLIFGDLLFSRFPEGSSPRGIFMPFYIGNVVEIIDCGTTKKVIFGDVKFSRPPKKDHPWESNPRVVQPWG